jgi:RNA polymerase sigma-70 factor (ECF subfamily)
MVDSVQSSTITTKLLNGVRLSCPSSWAMIVSQFSPRITQWLIKAGVESGDIPDLIQDVWRSVFISLDKFQRVQPGDTFRGWLRTITQRRVADYYETKAQQPFSFTTSRTLQNELPDLVRPGDAEVRDSEKLILLHGFLLQIESEVIEHTWLAFRLHVLENNSAEDVAEQLKIGIASVYTAKSRILRRLRELFKESETGML